jgi:hypothetical protein
MQWQKTCRVARASHPPIDNLTSNLTAETGGKSAKRLPWQYACGREFVALIGESKRCPSNLD